LTVSTYAQAPRPNVVIIIPDDISYQDMGAYQADGPRTPHLDRLGAQSVRLADFHVSPSCAPTRAALLTGRYSNATGVWHTILGRTFLRTDEVTLAEVFGANGYRTGLFGKWHLGDNYPFRAQDRGFEHVSMLRGGGIDQQQNYWGSSNLPPSFLLVNEAPVALTDEDDGIEGAFLTNTITGSALRFMGDRPETHRPFFALVAYNAVHTPHDLPPDARPGLTAKQATTENLDKNIGRILAFLDNAGLAENTLVIFFPDNGMANARQRGDKTSAYEGGHQVPCYVRWPAAGLGGAPSSGRTVEALTAHIDLFPTLLDLLGLADAPARTRPLHGRSLRSLLLPDVRNIDPGLLNRTVIVDNQRQDHLEKFKQVALMRDEYAAGAITRKWRLVRQSGKAAWELYDLVSDPLQQRDLVSEPRHQPLIAQLGSEYDRWWTDVSLNADTYPREIIGSPKQPEVCLYAHDWHLDGTSPWNHGMIAAGVKAFGFNAVAVDQPGRYLFDLRRWPKEIAGETSLASGLATALPHPLSRNADAAKGVALPIASARLRVWRDDQVLFDSRVEAAPAADGVSFAAVLPAGPAQIQTWFYDRDGQAITGAYYVYVSGPAPTSTATP
jgi:arylsulfatase A-like enzyme